MNNHEIKLTRNDIRYANYLRDCSYYSWLIYAGNKNTLTELIREALLSGKERGYKEAMRKKVET